MANPTLEQTAEEAVKQLEADLNSMSTTTNTHLCVSGYSSNVSEKECYEEFTDTIEEPNKERRIEAVKRAARLFQLSPNPSIKRVIKNAYFNGVAEVRKEAGKCLGYSWPRLLFHNLYCSLFLNESR